MLCCHSKLQRNTSLYWGNNYLTTLNLFFGLMFLAITHIKLNHNPIIPLSSRLIIWMTLKSDSISNVLEVNMKFIYLKKEIAYSSWNIVSMPKELNSDVRCLANISSPSMLEHIIHYRQMQYERKVN